MLQSIQRDPLAGIRNERSEALGPGHDTQAAMHLGAVDGLALHGVSAPGGLDADQIERALVLAVTATLHPTRKQVRKIQGGSMKFWSGFSFQLTSTSYPQREFVPAPPVSDRWKALEPY
nr:hypothetical protein [Rhodococcus wratislaviensis]